MNEVSSNSPVCRVRCEVTGTKSALENLVHYSQDINYWRAIIATIWSRPAALSLLASTVLLGHSVCGQEAATALAPLIATNQPLTTLNPQPSTLPTDLRLGPFDIQPQIAARVTYDDNIFTSSRDPKPDVFWSLQPSFLAVAGDRLAIEDYRRTYHEVVSFSPDTFIITEPSEWPGRTLMVDYGPRFNWFTKYNQNNCVDEFLKINALWPMHKMILGLRQDYTREDTAVVEAGGRARRQTIPTILMAGYQFSERTTAEVNLNYTSVSYEQDQGLADYTDWNWDNWLNYQYSPLFNLALGANLGVLDLPSQPRQTYEIPMVRARFRYGSRILLDGSVGVQLRQYEGGIPHSTEPVFSLTAHYEASDRSSFRLTGFQRETPSIFFGFNYLSTGASLGFQQRFGDRYYASLEMTYYDINYLGTSPGFITTAQAKRVDNVFEVRPAFEVRFSRHLFGSVFYLFRTAQSAQWDGWTDNQIGTRFSWAF